MLVFCWLFPAFCRLTNSGPWSRLKNWDRNLPLVARRRRATQRKQRRIPRNPAIVLVRVRLKTVHRPKRNERSSRARNTTTSTSTNRLRKCPKSRMFLRKRKVATRRNILPRSERNHPKSEMSHPIRDQRHQLPVLPQQRSVNQAGN